MPKNVSFHLPDAGRRMRDAIIEKNIDITQVARQTGMSRNTIYYFLYNGTDISSARLMKLCTVVGVSSDYILGLRAEK